MGAILRYRDFLKTYKTRGYRLNHLKSYKHLFPIKSSSTLAGVAADLIGDGNLQGDPKWRLDFTSKSLDELKRFGKEIFFLFKIKGKIRKCKSNKYGKTYNFAINCSPIARILNLCGVPAGQKVLKPFKIPNWIRQDRGCFKRFCQRLFSCEGCIMYEKGRKFPQIRLDMWKTENLLKDGKEFIDEIAKGMYKYFRIKSKVIIQNMFNIRKDGSITRPIRLYIFNESVVRFFNKIGFEGSKQKDLKALISSNL